MRTAFSPNIKERQDFSCAVFDARGQLCAQAAHIPVHLGSMAFAMNEIVNDITWHKGDMIMLNDPYKGGTHLPDVTLIAPVFINQELCAYVANRAHHADIGAISPGSMPLASTLSDEGLIISPTKIMENSRVCEKKLNHILQHLRNRDTARADFSAQMSANFTGIKRLTALIRRMGQKKFRTYLVRLNEYASELSANALAAIPDGSYQFSDYMDDDGQGNTDIKIEATINKSQEDITVDFKGTAMQVAGNINCPLSVTAAAVYYCFYCLMPAHTPPSAGSFSRIKIHAPDGCLINARYPAAVAAGNVETSTRIVDVVLGALAGALPEEIPAASHGSMNNIAMGNKDWDYYETLGGGMGAGFVNHGLDAIQTHMTNTLNTPIEVLENYFPLRIRKYAVRNQSGGNGRHVGGQGLIREYEFLDDTTVTLLTERRKHAPWGLNGGENGNVGINMINEREIPGKISFQARSGDILTIRTAGGGGWGRAQQC